MTIETAKISTYPEVLKRLGMRFSPHFLFRSRVSDYVFI